MPVEAGADRRGLRCVRVFEIVRASESDAGDGLDFFEVDLPTAWARVHRLVDVSLTQSEDFGWGAELLGDGGDHLIGFPWYDHVEQMLLDPEGGELPPDLSTGRWDDLEQGWWASMLVEEADVYIAEADLGALLDVKNPADLALVRPGVVSVAGVAVLWNRVPRDAYEHAWARAVQRLQSIQD
jgi:hypothetical protein